jgi:hypothetical protein
MVPLAVQQRVQSPIVLLIEFFGVPARSWSTMVDLLGTLTIDTAWIRLLRGRGKGGKGLGSEIVVRLLGRGVWGIHHVVVRFRDDLRRGWCLCCV